MSVSSLPVQLSRRNLLRAPAVHLREAAAVTAGVTAVAVAAVPAEAAGADQVLHLLRRATFGPTPKLVTHVKRTGVTKWLDDQLDPAKVSDTAVDKFVKRFTLLNLRTWELREKVDADEVDGWDAMYETVQEHLARQLFSNRQVLEVTVDFWTNHLVIPTPSSEVWDNAHLFARDVVRKYALGKYSLMLAAAARHPAMLSVLNNRDSSKKYPNENYGRELLELHTVGVGHYTEPDVKNSALILTGLSVDNESGLYEYKANRHYVGPVRVGDFSAVNDSAEDGEKVVADYLDYLAHHPDTAKRLATKLCVRFVSDTPPASLVRKLAKVYLDADTAMAPVLKALFTSTEFASSVRQKVKTPYEDSLATLRLLGAQPEKSGTDGVGSLFWNLENMNNRPYGWPAPNGYPDIAGAWAGAGATLSRWNFHQGVAAGWNLKELTRPDLADLLDLSIPPTTHGALMDKIASTLLVGPLTSTQRGALCAFLDKTPTSDLKASDAALGWRLPYLVALLLDSPNHSIR